MEALEIISVPVIVTIVYAMMELFKSAFGAERIGKFIPLFAVTLGALIGFCVASVKAGLALLVVLCFLQ